MIRINPKRSATYWRIVLLLLGSLGSTDYVSSAPASSEKSKERRPSSLSSPKGSSEQDIGSPSELAWQAWLLVDAQPGSNSGLESASILRRITPKSVFIAPQLQACAEGYEADNMGRCQKIVNIDQEAHLSFLWERLNKLYGKGASPAMNSPIDNKQTPVVSGPLQLNIPLLPKTSKDESNSQVEKDESSQEVLPLETKNKESVIDHDARNKSKVAEVTEEKHETVFLDSNSSVHKEHDRPTSLAFVIPIADFIGEPNDTFTDIVDYKVSPGLEINVNRTLDHGNREGIDLRKDDTMITKDSWKQEENSTRDDSLMKEDDLTTLSSRDCAIEDEDCDDESTTVTHMIGKEIVTESLTQKEMINDGIVDIGSEMETWRNESDASPLQGTKKNETIETDVVYEEEPEPDLEDQEEYSDTTHVSEEDSGESEDEILKHGETGMTIPIENQVLIRSEKKTHAPKDDYPMETTTFFEEESDSITTTEGGEDLESNVSSEVSINKDFVLETTLLDVNTGKVKNSTKPVSANSTGSQQNRDDDLKALFEAEKKLITEPEVVFSPQDNRGLSIYGRKRDGQLLKTNFQSIKESHNLTTTESPAASKPLPHLIRFEDHVAHPIEDQASFHSEKILSPDTKNKFPFRSHNLDPKPPDFGSFGRPIPVNSRRTGQDFVRFPNQERPRLGHVKFPSDDVNSIHNPEFKGRFTFSHEDCSDSSTSTKSSLQFNQKQSNWWVPPPPRMNRQHMFMHAQASSNQNPMLLKFWARMPLLRDPSLDPKSETPPSEKEASSRSSRVSPSRRINFYKETAPHEVQRVFSQNMRTPIGG